MKKRPNIVCFIMDDTDFLNLSAYGGQIPTPNIDKIGNNGAVFTNFYCSASVCTPSRYSYMSGRYAGRCTYDKFLQENPLDDVYNIGWNVVLTENDPISLGRILSESGYKTGYVGKWHAGQPTYRLNLPEFNENEDPTDSKTDKKLKEHQEKLCAELTKSLGFDFAGAVYWNNAEALPIKSLRYHNIDWITNEALNFLDSISSTEPFFLYMATTTYHGPDHAASFEQNPSITPGGIHNELGKYNDVREKITHRIKESNLPYNHRTVGMTWTDESFKAVMDKVQQLGVADNTIFIFSVDHNTENGKGTCYETGVKIPFMISWPKVIPEGTVINSLTQNIDLLPTLLDAAGIKNTDEYPIDGKSMLPILKNSNTEIHEDLFFEFGYSRAVRAGNWKYIAVRYTNEIYDKLANGKINEVPNLSNMPEQGQAKINIHAFENCLEPDQLYNLEIDPLEQNNLAELPQFKDKLQQMKNKLKRYTDSFDHPFPSEPHPFHKSKKFSQLLEITKKNHPAETIPWYNKNKSAQRGWPLDFNSLLNIK